MTQVIPRSDTYQKIFSDELMLEAFGTLMPTVSQRTSYFFERWIEWRPYQVKLKPRVDQAVRNLALEIGLKEFWEFQVREGEIRFKNKEVKAFALMTGLDAYTFSLLRNINV